MRVVPLARKVFANKTFRKAAIITAPYAAMFTAALISAPDARTGLVLGICNLQHVIYACLSDLIKGIKGREEELSKQFKQQTDLLKEHITKFANGLVDRIKKELGFDALDLNLDAHDDVSHVIEDWVEEIKDWDNPGRGDQMVRLKEMLQEKIGLNDKNAGILDKQLNSAGFKDVLGEFTKLKNDVSTYIVEHPGVSKDKKTGSNGDLKDLLTDEDKKKGGKTNGA